MQVRFLMFFQEFQVHMSYWTMKVTTVLIFDGNPNMEYIRQR